MGQKMIKGRAILKACEKNILVKNKGARKPIKSFDSFLTIQIKSLPNHWKLLTQVKSIYVVYKSEFIKKH